MDLQLTERSLVVFDLDDTLYSERDYVCSGFAAVARALREGFGIETGTALYDAFDAGSGDPVGDIIRANGLPETLKPSLLQIYRFHFPDLALPEASAGLLARLNALAVPMAVITDGRSVTQRLKLASLGIRDHFTCICVSEEVGAQKPDPAAFLKVMACCPDYTHFVYIADNPRKDFFPANQLGWQTIGVLHDRPGIHSQDAPADARYLPSCWVSALTDIIPMKEYSQ